jgi:hypothetical protein
MLHSFIKSALKSCKAWVFLIESCFGLGLGSLDGVLRPSVPINPTAHLLQFFAGGLPALLAVLALLLVKSVSKADPKSTAKQDAKNGNNDAVCLGAAMFRVIKTWAAIVDVLVFHERTRERAHAQQYAVPGMPCQRLFLPLPFFFTRLGRVLTLATVSR